MGAAEQPWGLVGSRTSPPGEESPTTPLCLLTHGPPWEFPSICALPAEPRASTRTHVRSARVGTGEWSAVRQEAGAHRSVGVKAALPHCPGILLSSLEGERGNRGLSEGVQGPRDPAEQELWCLRRGPTWWLRFQKQPQRLGLPGWMPSSSPSPEVLWSLDSTAQWPL